MAPILIMTLLIAACSTISNEVFDKRISEGIIEYDITFPEMDDQSITATLLPETMEYSFKENSFSSEFEAAGGVFKNRILANGDAKKVDHELKVFRKKVKVQMDDSDVLKMLAEYPKMTIIETQDTDTIVGYHCQKALVVFEEINVPEIEIYYTKDIKMNTPNWCTQYRDIEGVLMAYEIEEFGIRMKLVASSVERKSLAPEAMQVDEGYTPISKESMDVELAQLVETFEL
jgi:hypothetical protein